MTVTKTISLGYIGCGVMGRVYMRAAQGIAFVCSAAVADLNIEKAQQAAEAFGIDRVHASADELLADPTIDAVVLALPASARTELAIRAFRAGKDVLTEKPVAMNADEVRRLIDARGTQIAGCCSARLRCQDSADAVAAVVASGRLGELRVIRSCWQSVLKPPQPGQTPPAWRLSTAINGGGNLANLGSYALDYLLGVTGWTLEPEQVLARTWGVPAPFTGHVAPGSDAESLTTAMISFKGGAALLLEQGELRVGPQETLWQITGTLGTLSFCILPRTQAIVLHTYEEGEIREEIVWEGAENFSMMQERLLADFAEAVVKRRPPKTSLEQALVVRELLDAIYASASSGRAVAMAETV